ncbi:MAG: FimV/HubP family polar landmark protein, partial [Gallionella sp.]
PEAAVTLPAETSAVKSAPAKQEPSLVDQAMAMLDEIFAEPLYLLSGAGTLLALGGLGWVASRRKKRPSFEVISKFTEKAESETGHHIAIQPDTSPEKADFTDKIADQGEQSQDVDPISEADLFLNFGRDVQAEEILKDALQNTPNNHRIHLKLLEIYAVRKDVNAFAAIVRQLQDSGDEEACQRALAMGRELEPNNPMYGDSKGKENSGSGDMQAQDSNAMPNLVTGIKSTAKPPSIDFDLGSATSVTLAQSPEQDNMEKTIALSPDAIAAKSAGGMDFDISATNSTTPVAGEQEKSTMPDLDDLIFDVTGQRPAIVEGQEVSLPKLDEKTFDLPGNKPSMRESQVEDKSAHSDDSTMEFILDFPVEDKAQKSELVALPADVDLAGISLDLDDTAASISSTTEIKDEHWQEVATKLDLAKAYQEMGDANGAREILEEVLREGDDAQRKVAQALLDQLG